MNLKQLCPVFNPKFCAFLKVLIEEHSPFLQWFDLQQEVNQYYAVFLTVTIYFLTLAKTLL